MDEMGLAQQSRMPSIQEVAQMLEQGVTPEELMAAGLPQELIEAAIQMLTQAATQVPNDQAGMANMVLPQPGM